MLARPTPSSSFLKLAAWTVLIAGGSGILTGCGILLGNVKPVEEKSTTYALADLSAQDARWIKLPPPPTERESDEGAPPLSDVAYQSKRTSSIISLNSACRASGLEWDYALKTFTEQLLLGVTEVTRREEQSFELQGVPALQTTLWGKLSGEDMTLRTVVLQKQHCVYDLMFVAKPEYFDDDSKTFGEFVASLRLNSLEK